MSNTSELEKSSRDEELREDTGKTLPAEPVSTQEKQKLSFSVPGISLSDGNLHRLRRCNEFINYTETLKNPNYDKAILKLTEYLLAYGKIKLMFSIKILSHDPD